MKLPKTTTTATAMATTTITTMTRHFHKQNIIRVIEIYETATV